jgi:hypothetical protein
MIQHDSTNAIFHLAADLVNNTSRHLFLTGKAGTGKTTFLKYIKENTTKKTVIVAPTGVAAINASGVTIHSFFQLPFGPFIPGTQNYFSPNNNVTDKHTLFKNIRFNASKRELLEELELLIIDEVSMVRSDMLDAIDAVLRHFRKKHMLPFGGVQMVYIGDMYQLPPVIQQEEWNILKSFYDSPFFFHSRALKEATPLNIELKKIYRQNEQQFVDILNRIRNNKATKEDLDELNKRFDPLFDPLQSNKFITLTTHNRKADTLNESQLQKLPGRLYSFKAELSGDFSDKALPADLNLQLKEGAQVMFIKNDSGSDRKYFNGKIGTIKKISNEEISVSFSGEEDLKLEKETWKNVRYDLNKEKDIIEEEELGSFKQFPIRLAWAITIHKSQGLTFDRAVIDAGASFAPGQVYVALSRCTSLNGLVLHSRIYPNAIATDERILAFSQEETEEEYLVKLIVEEKEKYQAELIGKAFEWFKVVKALQEWGSIIPDTRLTAIDSIVTLNRQLIQKASEQEKIALKFQQQLHALLSSGNIEMLVERVNKAILFFGKALDEELIRPFNDHLETIRYGSKVKRYYAEACTFFAVLINQMKKLNAIKYRDVEFVKYNLELLNSYPPLDKKSKKKSEKGSTQNVTLELFRQKKSIEEIALMRNLAISTIESHLASFISSGEISIDELVKKKDQEVILQALEGADLTSLSSIKHKLSDEITYGEIRAMINYQRLVQSKKQPSFN